MVATATTSSCVNPPYVAEDGSIAPIFSNIPDQTHLKLGAVFQARSGAFVYGGRQLQPAYRRPH